MNPKRVPQRMIKQGIFPLILFVASMGYVAGLFSFDKSGPVWGSLLLILLFAALASKAAFFLNHKHKLEEDVVIGLLAVLSVKALGQALAWGVCGYGSTATACGSSFQGLEFLAFAFFAIYYPPLWMAGFAVFAGALELGFSAGPSVLRAAAEPDVVLAAFPMVATRFFYDLIFGVAFGYFVRTERETREDVEDELKRLAREAKTFRLDDIVAKPEAGLEAISRAGREDAEMRAVTRLREKEGNIAKFLKQTLRCYSAVIFRYNPDTEALELRAWRSDSRNVNPAVSLKPGEGNIGWIYNNRKVLRSGEKDRAVADLPYYKSHDEGIYSFLGAPIIDAETDRVLGVLAVDSKEVGVFDEEHRMTLDMGALMLVEAIRNEESRSRQETESLQLQAMLELSRQVGEDLDVAEICKRVVLSVFSIVPYRAAAVTLWDEEKGIHRVEYAALANDELTEAKEMAGLEFDESTETAVSLAMRQDSPLLIANYRQRDKSKRIPLWAPGVKLPDVDSVLAVPLKRGSLAVGCLTLGAVGNGVFEETERKLFGILGTLFSAALLNAQKHRATEERASTDALTGLANRVKFKEFYGEQIALSKRSKQPLSLLMLDLDYFKKVNDTYGHPAGDAVLKQMADILRKESRETDLPTRYGGEEFLAVLVNTPRKDATRMAERIRKAVEAHAFELPDGRTIRVTVSIGAATFPDDTPREDALSEKTDQALYGAKANGRNRVQVYCDLPDRDGTTSWSGRKDERDVKTPAPVSGSKPWRF